MGCLRPFDRSACLFVLWEKAPTATFCIKHEKQLGSSHCFIHILEVTEVGEFSTGCLAVLRQPI